MKWILRPTGIRTSIIAACLSSVGVALAMAVLIRKGKGSDDDVQLYVRAVLAMSVPVLGLITGESAISHKWRLAIPPAGFAVTLHVLAWFMLVVLPLLILVDRDMTVQQCVSNIELFRSILGALMLAAFSAVFCGKRSEILASDQA